MTISNDDCFFEEKAPVYKNYPGQSNVQPAYIEIDARDDSVYVSYDAEIGNAVPAYLWNGYAVRIGISPYATGRSIKRFIDSHMDDFQSIVSDWEEVYNGHNYVGRFGEKAEEIINDLEDSDDDLETVSVYDVMDWFADEIKYNHDSYTISGKFQIDGTTTDEQIEVIGDYLDSISSPDFDEYIDGNIYERLESLRNEFI